MSLFNKRILKERINRFPFPSGNHQKIINKIINGWQIALSEHDLEKTKEKSVQGEFLLKFFESILGYSSHSSGKSEWNLISSPKTEVDAQEADGSLGFFSVSKPDVTKAVIELKDSQTSLDKKQIGREKGYTPIEQGYLYSTKFDKCSWIIVSNFKEIRLYNKTRTQDFYETFDVLKLNEIDEFKRFYYILCKENLISQIGNSIIDELVKETNFQEENITKEFYKKYKETRYKLFEHIVYNNPNINKEIILEKTQKIIDRVVFVSFCEDLGLLPPNIFRRLLEAVKQSYDLSENKIWNQVKGLFHSINIGNPPMDINKFNGGLFSEDSIFDNLLIKDEVLIELLKISDYDFESDLNVNILGHIFEQSISDIEEMKASINEIETVKKEGKRKKEGIYYTPEYITKYIVEQAVGGWLEDRKKELGFNTLPELSEEDYKTIKITRGKLKACIKVEAHIYFWESYREILQNIKVLDPACGSGAFLIQVFDYLYKEGQLVNDELSKLKKGQRQIFDLDKHILTNNIYGVDLNEESVEITKLSLWLKTANKGKELTALDKNIKCGNSLIDDPIIAEKKAFDWKTEFKDILDSGGFDVIISNPPWGAHFQRNEKNFIKKNYPNFSGESESYIYFISMCISKILKLKGMFGFITPNTWLYLDKYLPLREVLLSDHNILSMIELEKGIFKDSPDIIPTIFFVKRTKKYLNFIETYKLKKKLKISNLSDKNLFTVNTIDYNDWKDFEGMRFNLNLSKEIKKILNKINDNPGLNNFYNVRYGIKTGNNKLYVKNNITNKADNFKKCLSSADNIKRYLIDWNKDYLDYSNHLAGYSENSFERPKIVVQYIRKLSLLRRLVLAIDEKGVYYPLNNFSFIELKDGMDLDQLYYLLGILNSKLMNYYFANVFIDYNIKPKYLKKLPFVVKDNSSRELIINKVKEIIKLKKSFSDLLNNSLEILKIEFGLSKPSKRINLFYSLSNENFFNEVKKINLKLSIKQKDELQEWFIIKSNQLNDLAEKIDATDNLIDNEVYKIYKLTVDEIKTIEDYC